MSKQFEERESFVDFLGQTVKVGDTIVYPARQSSSLWMNKATVEKIRVYRSQYYSGGAFHDIWDIKLSTKGHLSQIDRVVKVFVDNTSREVL